MQSIPICWTEKSISEESSAQGAFEKGLHPLEVPASADSKDYLWYALTPINLMKGTISPHKPYLI